MFRVKIKAKSRTLTQLRELAGSDAKFKRNVATAINKTQTKGTSILSKKITGELAVSQKVVKDQLRKGQKAGKARLSTDITLVAAVDGSKNGRLPLKTFKPRQTKKGVSYRISKSKGRKVLPGAFMGPRPGAVKASWRGHVFKRQGKQRLPIWKQFGPSPWGVYQGKKYDRKTRKEIKLELRKQVDRRLRFLQLKKSGKI